MTFTASGGLEASPPEADNPTHQLQHPIGNISLRSAEHPRDCLESFQIWTAWPCTFGSIGQVISIFYLCSAWNANIPSLKIYIKVDRYPSKCQSIWSLIFFAAEFSIWTREAGAGGLSIAVEGPSKAEIAFEDRKDGSCGVSYIVQEPGIYCSGYTVERKAHLLKLGEVLVKSYICQMCELSIYFSLNCMLRRLIWSHWISICFVF